MIQKAIPNRKSNEEPLQDNHMTISDPQVGGYPQFTPTLGGSFCHPQTTQNETQNDQKSKRKIKRRKERSKTILDPSWGDLGRF